MAEGWLSAQDSASLQNQSKRNQMLVAAAAVGVATVFAAPFSGEARPRFPHSEFPHRRAPQDPAPTALAQPSHSARRRNLGGRWGRSRSFRRLSGESFRRLPGALTAPAVEGRRGWAPRRAAVPWTDLGFKLGAPARSRAVSPARLSASLSSVNWGRAPSPPQRSGWGRPALGFSAEPGAGGRLLAPPGAGGPVPAAGS